MAFFMSKNKNAVNLTAKNKLCNSLDSFKIQRI